MAYKGSKAQSAIGAKIYIGPKSLDFGGLSLTGVGAATVFTFTGTAASASTAMTSVSSTLGLYVGQLLSGTGIAAGTTIAAIPASTTLTLSLPTSGAITAGTITASAFTEIGEMSQVPLSGYKYDKEDVTNFDSGETKEYIKTLLDSGTVALEGNRVSSDPGQAALYLAFLDPANAYEFMWQYPLANGQATNGDVVSFAALVEQWDDNLQVGKAIKRKASLQRTGAVTFTVGS